MGVGEGEEWWEDAWGGSVSLMLDFGEAFVLMAGGRSRSTGTRGHRLQVILFGGLGMFLFPRRMRDATGSKLSNFGELDGLFYLRLLYVETR
jgi:hypothetical protein